MCVCVCDVCPASCVPAPPVPPDGARLGELRSEETGGFAFYWGAWIKFTEQISDPQLDFKSLQLH